MIGMLAAVAVLPWVVRGLAVHHRCARLTQTAPAHRDADPESLVDTAVVLELLGTALRAGAGVPRALDAVGTAVGGPDAALLARVSGALRRGADWAAAWGDTPDRFDAVARALRPAWEDGASPGAALTAAAEELHRDRRDTARTAAGRLGVRLVLPLGACFLPAFLLVGLVPVLLSLGKGLLGP